MEQCHFLLIRHNHSFVKDFDPNHWHPGGSVFPTPSRLYDLRE